MSLRVYMVFGQSWNATPRFDFYSIAVFILVAIVCGAFLLRWTPELSTIEGQKQRNLNTLFHALAILAQLMKGYPGSAECVMLDSVACAYRHARSSSCLVLARLPG